MVTAFVTAARHRRSDRLSPVAGLRLDEWLLDR
jgi:hypothetical protein